MMIKSQQELRTKLVAGANKLAETVGSTLGPRGHTVILHKTDTSETVITKDGVTCANFIKLDDPVENIGAQLIKQVAQKTNEQAGDGTTTSTILANELLSASQQYLVANVNAGLLKKGIELAKDQIVVLLRQAATPIRSIKDIENIATVAANNDRIIGKLISDAVKKIGKDGTISIKESKRTTTELEFLEGFRLSSGYLSTKFINNEKHKSVFYENPLILVTDFTISTVDEMLPVIELAAREKRPLFIVAGEVENQALASLILNSIRGTLKIAAVNAPGFGEERINILEDLAVSVGAKFIAKDRTLSLKEIKLSDFGSCASVECTKQETIIIDGKCNLFDVADRIITFKEQVKHVDLDDAIKIQERIARLSCGIAVIHVGGLSDTEIIEKKHRIEDALEAVKSAQQEGILPGGGISYRNALTKLEIPEDIENDAKYGYNIIIKALAKPFALLSQSINDNEKSLLRELDMSFPLDVSPYRGINFAENGMVIENMLDCGLVDAAKVSRCALENAVSVVGTLITTNFAVIE